MFLRKRTKNLLANNKICSKCSCFWAKKIKLRAKNWRNWGKKLLKMTAFKPLFHSFNQKETNWSLFAKISSLNSINSRKNSKSSSLNARITPVRLIHLLCIRKKRLFKSNATKSFRKKTKFFKKINILNNNKNDLNKKL